MSIETECPGCTRKLRVPVEHAGHQARCPVCSTIYVVPGGVEETHRGASEPALEQWRMRTPEGQLWGPTSKDQMDSWVSDGRVTADCELLEASQSTWLPADEVYPVLRVVQQETKSTAGSSTRYRYSAPHRGSVILVLGILAWVVGCPIFGFAAWVMGNADLQEMRAGRMDPSGRGLTQGGTILGMAQAILVMLAGVVFLFVLLARFAARM